MDQKVECVLCNELKSTDEFGPCDECHIARLRQVAPILKILCEKGAILSCSKTISLDVTLFSSEDDIITNPPTNSVFSVEEYESLMKEYDEGRI